VRARYSWSRVAADTLDVYRGLVAAPAEELALGS
jgi:hypothetical protein